MSLIAVYKKFRKNFSGISDVILFSRIFFVYIFIPVLLAALPLPFLMRVLTPKRRKPTQDKKIDRILKYTDFISLKLNCIFKATCLKKSLVLYRFLSIYEPGVTFNLGIISDKEKLSGHSWLSFAHKTLFFDRVEAEKFKKIYSYSCQN